MIMSTSNQRASNIFKSSQEPNTNKKNKKRHKIPFNKIQPPITISFNLGREFNKKDVSTYGVYRQSSTICTEGWQPRKVEKNAWWWTLTLNLFSHNTLTQAWRSLKNWWPTMTNKKTIISNIISIESYHPWKHIKKSSWTIDAALEGGFISLKKRWLVPLSGEIYRTLPPSDSTIDRNPSDSPCPNLGQIRNGTSWRPCVVLRASPSATCNGHFFAIFVEW